VVILARRDVTFLQGWLLPRLGGQGALCRVGSLSSIMLFPPLHRDEGSGNEDREEGTQHNGGTVLTVV